MNVTTQQMGSCLNRCQNRDLGHNICEDLAFFIILKSHSASYKSKTCLRWYSTFIPLKMGHELEVLLSDLDEARLKV
jgi:hypothetical protein